MAEFNGPVLQFDSVVLDVNENPSNTAIRSCADINKQHELELSKTETFCSYDLTQSDILQSPEAPTNYIEMPEILNEVSATNLDSLNNDDVKHEFDVPNAIIHPFTTSDDHVKSPEMCNDKNVNHINACDNYTEPSVNELIDQLNGLSCQSSENPFGNHDSDSGIHDWENNVVEGTTNDTDFVGLNMSNGDGFMMTDFKNEEIDLQVKDEEFHDAVQFFKDPSSFTFLENAGSSSTTNDPLLTRSSLYVNFDPLHAKFFSQPTKSEELHGIAEDDTEPEKLCNDTQIASVPDIFKKPDVPSYTLENNNVPDIVNKPEILPNTPQNDNKPDIVNKNLNISPRESLGNILISFDSPITSKDVHPQCLKTESVPPKLYTEEELQQALKIQELTVQETFLKNQHDLEMSRSLKQQEMENKIKQQNRLCNTLHCLLNEFADVASSLSEKNNLLHEKVEVAEKENDRLKEDLKTSVEDLQSVEHTFADFHKRYEQCKNMLKVYNQNEDNLKQQLENMKVQLQEKEEMYKVLQSRTQEMLDKANQEVVNAKKTGDAQVAVLKAQLKKAEMKISSLESDVKHVKIENSKLSSICDDLMAKVSET